MKILGVIIGLAGMVALCINIWLGGVILLIGLLVFMTAVNQEKRALEERRHYEMIKAIKERDNSK